VTPARRTGGGGAAEASSRRGRAACGGAASRRAAADRRGGGEARPRGRAGAVACSLLPCWLQAAAACVEPERAAARRGGGEGAPGAGAVRGGLLPSGQCQFAGRWPRGASAPWPVPVRWLLCSVQV